MEPSIQAVVPAAGYGVIQEGKTKLVEPIRNKALICHTLEILQASGFDQPVIVINHRFGGQIVVVTKEYSCLYAKQDERKGTADAVFRALPLISAKHLLVIYPDMPLWSPQTIKELIATHFRLEAVITIVKVSLVGEYEQCLSRYGRILRDEKGKIVKIAEPDELNPETLSQLKECHPSLFCFQKEWFASAISQISPICKKDNFPDEMSLAKLVEIASKQNASVGELTLTNPQEALGINTPEDYQFVTRLLAGA